MSATVEPVSLADTACSLWLLQIWLLTPCLPDSFANEHTQDLASDAAVRRTSGEVVIDTYFTSSRYQADILDKSGANSSSRTSMQ